VPAAARRRPLRGGPLLLAGCLAVASACAVHVRRLPDGPGAPAPDAAAAWREATAECRDVHNATALLRVAVGRSPSVAVGINVSAAGGLRLDGAQMFLLAGTADHAELLLPSDRRLVVAPAADIVNALVGVKLAPAQLLAVLTGCVAVSPVMLDAARFDGRILVRTADSRVLIARSDGRWQVLAGDAAGVDIDYRRFDGYWPGEWRATPADALAGPVLVVSVDSLTVNDPKIEHNPQVYQLVRPPDTRPMTIEELRVRVRGGGA